MENFLKVNFRNINWRWGQSKESISVGDSVFLNFLKKQFFSYYPILTLKSNIKIKINKLIKVSASKSHRSNNSEYKRINKVGGRLGVAMRESPCTKKIEIYFYLFILLLLEEWNRKLRRRFNEVAFIKNVMMNFVDSFETSKILQ